MTRRPREGGSRGKGRNEQEPGLCPSETLHERMKRVDICRWWKIKTLITLIRLARRTTSSCVLKILWVKKPWGHENRSVYAPGSINVLLPFFGDLLIRLQPHESSYWPWGFIILNPDLMKAAGLIWPQDCPCFLFLGEWNWKSKHSIGAG